MVNPNPIVRPCFLGVKQTNKTFWENVIVIMELSVVYFVVLQPCFFFTSTLFGYTRVANWDLE